VTLKSSSERAPTSGALSLEKPRQNHDGSGRD
jgi:hypothetical protein